MSIPKQNRVDFRLAGESFTLGQLGVIKQYTGMDVLRFLAGIDASDVTASRHRNDLRLTIGSTGEVITVSSYFRGDGAGGYALDAIEFADGTVWDIDTVKTMVPENQP